MSRHFSAPLTRGALSLLVSSMFAGSLQASPISNPAAATSSTTSSYTLTGSTGSLPTGMTFLYSVRVTAGITYGKDADGSYVEFNLFNPVLATSDLTVDRENSGAYQAAFGSPISFTATDSLYRFSTKIKVMPGKAGETPPPDVDIWAKYFLNGNKMVPDLVEAIADNHMLQAQTLQNDVMAGAVLPDSGAAITSATPVLYVQNLLPQQRVLVRIYTASMNRYSISSNLIHAMDGVQTVRPGGVAKFTSKLSNSGSAAGLMGTYVAEYQLVNALGYVTPLGNTSLTLSKPGSTSALQDLVLPYQAALPQSLADGTYAVQLRLYQSGQTKGVRLTRASTSITETSSTTGGYAYRIGTVKVSNATGGIFIGATAVRYPYAFRNGSKVNAEDQLGNTSGPKQLGLHAIRSTLGAPQWNLAQVNGTFQAAFDPVTYTRAFVATDKSFHTQTDPRLTLADWSSYFNQQSAPKNLLLNTWGVPYEASSAPTNTDNGYYQGGIAAPVSANGSTAYADYLRQLFTNQNLAGRQFAVECGNEPNSRWFWSGTQTQLADSCKAIFDARKQANLTSIPIICPQADSPERMSYVLSAKTSAGQPITNYCDWLGTHVYSGMGSDTKGKPYSTFNLAEKIRMIRARMTTWGVGNKPIFITEFGIGRADYNNLPYNGRSALDSMPINDKADAVYQSIATIQEAGALGVMLYALDSGENFLWTLDASNPNAYDPTVMKRLGDARLELGTSRSPW